MLVNEIQTDSLVSPRGNGRQQLRRLCRRFRQSGECPDQIAYGAFADDIGPRPGWEIKAISEVADNDGLINL